jgi:AraC-like DNA-binding protein
LQWVRPATREELYRRLFRARDYMAASLGDRVTLNDIAHVACMSPNHLLRTFRQLFHQSPHQLLTDLRMERARRFLVESDRPVTDIAAAVGFESLGSFSSLFRRHTGVSPDQYRRAKSHAGKR